MIEIIKTLLLPKYCAVLTMLLLIIFLLLIKSRKIETKWITLDLDKMNPGRNDKGEILLRERLLKEYKLFRSNILSEINKLRLFFRSNFRESLLDYLEYLKQQEGDENILKIKHHTLKIYELLLELTMKTVISPVLIQMVFNNGFPKIGHLQRTSFKDYESGMEEFNAVCREKYDTVLTALEFHMDLDWFDSAIDPDGYKKYYHTINKKVIENTFKDTRIFFTIIIQQRDALVESVYNDFKRMFNSKEECQRFCEVVMREIYE